MLTPFQNGILALCLAFLAGLFMGIVAGRMSKERPCVHLEPQRQPRPKVHLTFGTNYGPLCLPDDRYDYIITGGIIITTNAW